MHIPLARVAALAVLLSLARTSVAIDTQNNYITRGIGSKDGGCGEYATSEATYKRWYEHWLMGYISGVNRYRTGKADFTNDAAVAGLTQWVENYCKENPLAPFSEAAEALLRELQKRR